MDTARTMIEEGDSKPILEQSEKRAHANGIAGTIVGFYVGDGGVWMALMLGAHVLFTCTTKQMTHIDEWRALQMRRLMAVLFVIAFMVCSSLSLAEGIDISTLSDDELVALLGQVQEEIVARHIEGTANLSSGTYIAGKDIPAGSYIYTCMASGNDWGNVTIYSEKGEGNQLFWEVVSAPTDDEQPESFFITLNEDDQLKSGVPFSLTIYTGVTFK